MCLYCFLWPCLSPFMSLPSPVQFVCLDLCLLSGYDFDLCFCTYCTLLIFSKLYFPHLHPFWLLICDRKHVCKLLWIRTLRKCKYTINTNVCLLTCRIKQVLHHMNHSIGGHEVIFFHIHGVHVNWVINLKIQNIFNCINIITIYTPLTTSQYKVDKVRQMINISFKERTYLGIKDWRGCNISV